jgi:cell wall-associated NlpC family hydrolase
VAGSPHGDLVWTALEGETAPGFRTFGNALGSSLGQEATAPAPLSTATQQLIQNTNWDFGAATGTSGEFSQYTQGMTFGAGGGGNLDESDGSNLAPNNGAGTDTSAGPTVSMGNRSIPVTLNAGTGTAVYNPNLGDLTPASNVNSAAPIDSDSLDNASANPLTIVSTPPSSDPAQQAQWDEMAGQRWQDRTNFIQDNYSDWRTGVYDLPPAIPQNVPTQSPLAGPSTGITNNQPNAGSSSPQVFSFNGYAAAPVSPDLANSQAGSWNAYNTTHPTDSVAGADGTSGTSTQGVGSRAALLSDMMQAQATKYGSAFVYPQTPGGHFDCSGFVKWALGNENIQLTLGQGSSGATQIINSAGVTQVSDPIPGDLVYWSTGSGAHIMIYTGNNNVYGASSPTYSLGINQRPISTYKALGAPTFYRVGALND